MAKSKFINYFAYTNLYSVRYCTVTPNIGRIAFGHHFREDAKIKFILIFVNQGHQYNEIKEDKLDGNTNITKDENNVYTFSAKEFPKDQMDLQDFQQFQIIISDGSYDASIVFNNTDQILENELLNQGYNNIFFQFSYDVNNTNCKQFNNCILHIGQDINSNFTYMKWVSPIASGNDIKPYITGTTSSESSSSYNDDTQFEGSLEKCIKATSSSTWTSEFEKVYATTNGPTIVQNFAYHGDIKSPSSKDYENGNLVRFQDINLSSISSAPPKVDLH